MSNRLGLTLITLACLGGWLFVRAGSRLRAAEDDAGAGGEAVKAEKEKASEGWKGRVVLIQITGDEGIAWDRRILVKDKVEKIFARIKREAPRLVVVEIDSPGGRVDTCQDLSKMFKACPVPIKALITHRAVSGGTVIATACDEIIMVEGSRIGDVKPILLVPGPYSVPAEIPAEIKEKVEQDVITLMESNAEANGMNKDILKAMVTPSVELYEVRLSDGQRQFLTKKELAVLEENINFGRDERSIAYKKLVCEAGRLLELTAKEAVEYNLAKKVVKNRDAFFREQNVESDDMIVAEVSDQDVVVRGFMPSLPRARELSGLEILLLGIFLVVGVAGVLTEANMPGFGIPGAIGIIGFACFFYLLVRAGNAQWYEIAIFVLGISLLIVEIVVLPGFGVPGILGVLLILGGLFLAFTPDLGTPYMEKHLWDEAARFTLLLGGVVFVVAILSYFAVTYGARLPFMRYLYLTGSLRSGAEVLAEAKAEAGNVTDKEKAALQQMVGKAGVATTPLRPAGKVRLDDGELIDVVTEGGLIQNGARIVVLEYRHNRVVVGPEPEGGASSAGSGGGPESSASPS